MSSYWAGYHGQGLVLSELEFEEFLKNYREKCTDDKSLSDLMEYEDGDKTLSDIVFLSHTGHKFNIICAGDDCTEGFRLVPYRIDGIPNTKWRQNEHIPFNNVYVLDADNPIDGMTCFEKKAYESYEAFVGEFKDKMNSCLPDDFDWDSHIGIFTYACFA